MEKSIHSRRYKEFLVTLRKMRTDRGILQQDIAEKLELTQGAYSKLETGDIRIDIVQLETICKSLGYSLSEFVKEFEKK